jgi:putative restriction endonuclease
LANRPPISLGGNGVGQHTEVVQEKDWWIAIWGRLKSLKARKGGATRVATRRRKMTRETVLQLFDKLNVWSRGDQRAPHKPLLVLYALGRWSRGETTDIPFNQVDDDLTVLLKEFGRPRHSYHPEYPFWRLQNDNVWVVHAAGPLTPRQSSTDAKKSDLLSKHAAGGFSPEVQAALRADPGLVSEIAARLLESHFPDSIHQDILDAVGLALGADKAAAKKRDPQFRLRVLTAYEYRCAVCGFDVRLGSVSIALDAAHIRWHQAGGADLEKNGLALCVLHLKTFDPAFNQSPYFSLAGGQLFEESGQRLADRGIGVGIVGVGRRSFFVEVWPLALHLSPFDVSLANEFFQKVIRVENPSATGGENAERLLIPFEQDFALLDAPQHDDFQLTTAARHVAP